MKQTFKSIMRVLFLAALLGAASAAETFVCDHVCVDAIYQEIAKVDPAAGYKDGDMAVYGYILYHAYTVAQAGGITYVNTVLNAIGTGCAEEGFDPLKRDGMADCFAAAEQGDVDEYEKAFESSEAEEKKIIDAIVGAIANQLAPGSVFAKAYPGISSGEFTDALNVYYIVGVVYEVFKVVEKEGVFADQDAKDACYAAVATAVEYDGGNLVEDLIANADKLEGAFAGEACFGGEAVQANLAEADFADELAITAAVGDDVTAAEANVAKLKGSQPTADGDDEADEESAAAALSAVVALLAMML